MLHCRTVAKASPNAPVPARHVVHGVLSLELGGLERLVLELIRASRRCHERVSVICMEREGVLAEQAREMGAAVYCLSKPAGRPNATVQSAVQLLTALRPDIVHTHQIGALWYLGRAVKQLEGGRVVHTEHSDHVTQAATFWGKMRARFWWWRAGRLAERFCCVSHDVAASVQRWQTIPYHKIAVVLNGIDVERVHRSSTQRTELRTSLGFPEHSLVVGTVGRLAEVKQHSLLLRALPALRSDLGDVRLLLIGEGPERKNLEQLAAQLGVERFVVFAGYQAEPFSYGSAMDVFVMTSRHEGLPLALLEAWAAGLPVVCSAVGGMEKVVEHGINGLLFPSGVRESLVSSLCEVLTCKDMSKRLAEAGQRTVEQHYSSESMAREYSKQYQLAGL